MTVLQSLIATSSSDGLAAWQAVVGEFRRTVEDPLAGWPIIAGIAVGLFIIWVNLRVARALLASFDDNTRHGGPDPIDHAR